MSKNLKIKAEKQSSKGFARKVFKFKSKVIVWNAGNHAKGSDGSAWRFARVPENISAQIKEMQI